MNDITSRFLEAYLWIIDNDKTPDTKTFAKELGISISMMTEIGKERSNIGIKAIQNIVKKIHINSEWLIAGTGDMLREEQTPPQPVMSQANEFYKELYDKEREKNEELSMRIGDQRGKLEIKDQMIDNLTKRIKFLEEKQHQRQIESFTFDSVVTTSEQGEPPTHVGIAGAPFAKKTRNHTLKSDPHSCGHP